jgi:hypothetical protein
MGKKPYKRSRRGQYESEASQDQARAATRTEDREVLEGAAISILNEIRDLPQVVTDPNWLRELEKEEGGR